MLIGVAFPEPVVQTVLIFLIILLFLVLCILLRPWVMTIQTVIELALNFFLLIISIVFLIMAARDKNCSGCDDREGGYCWFVIFLAFLMILAAWVGLLTLLALSIYNPKAVSVDKPKSVFVIEE